MRSCLQQLETVFDTNQTEMWKKIDRLGNNRVINSNGPDPSTLFKYCEEQCVLPEAPYFDHSFEYSAKKFLGKYDCGNVATNVLNVPAIDTLNRELDISEITGEINELQNNKAPGSDLIPAEFIKFYKNTLTADIWKLLNDILEKREFPDIWSKGFRTSVYKSGTHIDPNNYRGITISSIFTKMFEMAFHDRLLGGGGSQREHDGW